MKTRVPWDRVPRGLLSNARDSISHRTLVFILYPLHKILAANLYEDLERRAASEKF